MFDVSDLRRNWGSRSLNDAMKAVSLILEQNHFDLQRPIVLRNHSSGPVFDIRQDGEQQHRLLTATDDAGRLLQLGFGAASRGLTANELVPDPNYSLDPGLVNEAFSTQGLGDPSEPTDSLLSRERSGTGVPHTEEPYVPVAGWGSALASTQKSNDTEHAPDSAVKLTRDGNPYWWVTEPWKWQVVRCTVTAVNADTLTCNVAAHGKVAAEAITVAKPCYMQQTGWDGVLVDGVTYVYATSQTREATTMSDSSQEDQTVSPLYATTGPCTDIFAAWVGNNSGIAGVGWLDLNVDARQWFAV
jgi:hypothetical protein